MTAPMGGRWTDNADSDDPGGGMRVTEIRAVWPLWLTTHPAAQATPGDPSVRQALAPAQHDQNLLANQHDGTLIAKTRWPPLPAGERSLTSHQLCAPSSSDVQLCLVRFSRPNYMGGPAPAASE
jgi:hypothetical protein